MLHISSAIEGKQAYYGDIKDDFAQKGFHISNWEYYSAFFDTVLSRRGGVTIYLRLPAQVVQGKLDHENARLKFGRPFVIKHVMPVGIVEDDFDSSALDFSGINQFQDPLDPDDRIEREERWRQTGEQALDKIAAYVH